MKKKVVIFILIGFCLAVAVIAGFKVAFPVGIAMLLYAGLFFLKIFLSTRGRGKKFQGEEVENGD